MIISMSGTHGTGKSTSAMKLAYEYKLKYPNKKITIMTDVAAICPLPFNKKSTEESQLWIFSKFLLSLIELSCKYDYIIMDRSLMDVIAYTRIMGYNNIADSMFDIAVSYMKNYEKIYMKTIEKNDYFFKDGIRDSDDVIFRQNVENELKFIYEDLVKSKIVSEDLIEYI